MFLEMIARGEEGTYRDPFLHHHILLGGIVPHQRHLRAAPPPAFAYLLRTGKVSCTCSSSS